MRILSVVGQTGAGKSTLMAALAKELDRQHRRVVALRDGELYKKVLQCTDLDSLSGILRTAPECDLLLVEGMGLSGVPKVEVYRSNGGSRPLFEADSADRRDWIVVVTDSHSLTAPCQVLRFTDTIWIHLLSGMVWDRSKVLA